MSIEQNDIPQIAQAIASYYASQSVSCQSQACLSHVLGIIATHVPPGRVMSKRQLKHINRDITQVPTGRQKRWLNARDEVLTYLLLVCGWQMPKAKVHTLIDKDHRWFTQLHYKSALAAEIEKRYDELTSQHVKQPQHDANLAWTLLTLMIEVAPLSLSNWCERLNTPDPLECINGQMIIKIAHPKLMSYLDDSAPLSDTHYAMTPMATRAIYDWQSGRRAKVTVNKMVEALNHVLGSNAAYTAKEWQQIIQRIWQHRHPLPPDILKDFSEPMRHVSAPLHQRLPNVMPNADLYMGRQYNQQAPSHSAPPLGSYRQWPHYRLLREMKSAPEYEVPQPPAWDHDNLLPRIVFDYVAELHRYGGVKKDTLGHSTITRYTNFRKCIEDKPLSLAMANDRERLNNWAMEVYQRTRDDSLEKWAVYQLFRFMTQYPVTEHLDLTRFDSPTHPIKVDPLTLSADDIHLIAHTLLERAPSSLQSLFAAASVLLGYYGKLRRGELLRLLLQHIRCTSPKGQTFHLLITKTQEGAPKGNKTRWVHVTMPESAAKIVRLVLALKTSCAGSEPFLGLSHETLSMRAERYLLPVTTALKAHFGKRARFHHLRHAGATLLYQQALVLALEKVPESWRAANTPIQNEVLSEPFVMAQFDYWLEGRSFCHMNNMLLFDEIGRALGHEHYATTRLHYLHGMAWVATAFLPQRRTYSHAELRYLLGMKVNSNDIARVLPQLDESYEALTPSEKKAHAPQVRHQTLHARLAKSLKIPGAPINTSSGPRVKGDENHLFDCWRHQLVSQSRQPQTSNSHWERPEVIKALKEQTLSFEAVSELASWLGRYQGLRLSKSEMTALRALGEITLMNQENSHSLNFTVRGNLKVRHALRVLSRVGFNGPRRFILFQNRKSNKGHQWRFAQNELARVIDSMEKVSIATGKTHLSIQIPIPTAQCVEHFVQWWNTNIA
ncbi:hypothetical protein [Vibrio alfacsensis]|uniref:hypothetical protein n=1 Tax=Vibrio alfacsensis TaxID=1074311 RepID=UPI004068A99D